MFLRAWPDHPLLRLRPSFRRHTPRSQSPEQPQALPLGRIGERDVLFSTTLRRMRAARQAPIPHLRGRILKAEIAARPKANDFRLARLGGAMQRDWIGWQPLRGRAFAWRPLPWHWAASPSRQRKEDIALTSARRSPRTRSLPGG